MKVADIRDHLHKDLIILGGARLIPVAASILGLKITTSSVDSDQYGVAILIIAAAQMLHSLSTNWIGYVLVRYYPKYEATTELPTFVVTFAGIQALGSLLISILFLFWAYAWHYTDIMARPALFIPGLVYAALMPVSAFLQTIVQLEGGRKRLFYHLAVSSVISLTITVVGFKVYHLGGEVLIAANLAGLLTVLLMETPRLLARYPLTRFELSREILASGLKYGLPQVLVCLSVSILSTADRIFLEWFHGLGSVGIYAACYKLGEMVISLPSTIVAGVAAPLLVRCFQNHGIDESMEMISEIMSLFLVIFLPILAVITAYPEWIASFILDSKFAAHARLIPYITFGVFLFSLTTVLGMPFQLFEKPLYFIVVIGGSGLISVLINYLIIPNGGYFGAAIASMLGYTVYIAFLMVAIRKLFGVRVKWAVFSKPVAAALGATVVLVAGVIFPPTGFLTHVFSCLVFCAVYLFLLLLLKETYALKMGAVLRALILNMAKK